MPSRRLPARHRGHGRHRGARQRPAPRRRHGSWRVPVSPRATLGCSELAQPLGGGLQQQDAAPGVLSIRPHEDRRDPELAKSPTGRSHTGVASGPPECKTRFRWGWQPGGAGRGSRLCFRARFICEPPGRARVSPSPAGLGEEPAAPGGWEGDAPTAPADGALPKTRAVAPKRLRAFCRARPLLLPAPPVPGGSPSRPGYSGSTAGYLRDFGAGSREQPGQRRSPEGSGCALQQDPAAAPQSQSRAPSARLRGGEELPGSAGGGRLQAKAAGPQTFLATSF